MALMASRKLALASASWLGTSCKPSILAETLVALPIHCNKLKRMDSKSSGSTDDFARVVHFGGAGDGVGALGDSASRNGQDSTCGRVVLEHERGQVGQAV
ncbi:hypothetical protein BC828DRAFT_295926 [Blastocladiella britannica]|nr:hypothetical protein BC828DRAFT_295926 [Blastocladiella britannica]